MCPDFSVVLYFFVVILSTYANLERENIVVRSYGDQNVFIECCDGSKNLLYSAFNDAAAFVKNVGKYCTKCEGNNNNTNNTNNREVFISSKPNAKLDIENVDFKDKKKMVQMFISKDDAFATLVFHPSSLGQGALLEVILEPDSLPTEIFLSTCYDHIGLPMGTIAAPQYLSIHLNTSYIVNTLMETTSCNEFSMLYQDLSQNPPTLIVRAKSVSSKGIVRISAEQTEIQNSKMRRSVEPANVESIEYNIVITTAEPYEMDLQNDSFVLHMEILEGEVDVITRVCEQDDDMVTHKIGTYGIGSHEVVIEALEQGTCLNETSALLIISPKAVLSSISQHPIHKPFPFWKYIIYLLCISLICLLSLLLIIDCISRRDSGEMSIRDERQKEKRNQEGYNIPMTTWM